MDSVVTTSGGKNKWKRGLKLKGADLQTQLQISTLDSGNNSEAHTGMDWTMEMAYNIIDIIASTLHVQLGCHVNRKQDTYGITRADSREP